MSKVGNSVELCVSWVPTQNGHIPPNAVEAGNQVYIARTELNHREWVPGKACSGHPTAYVAYGDKTVKVNKYEVLCHSSTGCFGKGIKWVSSANGHVPNNALIGGNAPNGEPQYVARGYVNGDLCAGKVHPSHGRAYFAWGTESFGVSNYEVLCLCNH